MTGEQHTVSLPHPNRTGPRTTGTCACGQWSVTYGWGGHGDAAGKAEQHVVEAARAHPVRMQDMAGLITVAEGLSL